MAVVSSTVALKRPTRCAQLPRMGRGEKDDPDACGGTVGVGVVPERSDLGSAYAHRRGAGLWR